MREATPELKTVTFGVIGYRNHAERLLALIDGHPQARLAAVYHPEKDLSPRPFTNRLEDLFDLDAVMIASPTTTHFRYLDALVRNYRGYIFCEKPLVNTEEELAALGEIPAQVRKRVFVNFNFRYSQIAELFDLLENRSEYGEIVSVWMNTSFGLAFKPGYKDNWRADGGKNRHAITETGSVHYVDLLFQKLGPCQKYSYAPRNIAGTGTSYDTSALFLEFERSTAVINSSYAGPYNEELHILLTNALVTVRDGEIRIAYPRDHFDASGFFIAPPVVERKKVLFEEIYHDSLKRSFEQFVRYASEGEEIPQGLFDLSLRTNRFVLEVQRS